MPLDIEFYELLALCFKCRLSIRVTRYILWHYACNEPYRRIAELDGNNISYQSVEQMVLQAHEKIKSYTLRNQ